ncbi:MAG: hypothetical protein O3A42_17275, partial [Actinobacteria bacterium]|nr:hypothetical protein [Actinomycetota bacterium]
MPRRENSEGGPVAADTPGSDAVPSPSDAIATESSGAPASIPGPSAGSGSGVPAGEVSPISAPAAVVESVVAPVPAAAVDEVPVDVPVITAAPRGSVNSIGSALLSWLG